MPNQTKPFLNHYQNKQSKALPNLILFQCGVRDKTSIQFCSALGAIFGVQKYAAELSKICEKRDLNLNFRHNLVKLNAAERTATFDLLNADGVSTGKTKTMQV